MRLFSSAERGGRDTIPLSPPGGQKKKTVFSCAICAARYGSASTVWRSLSRSRARSLSRVRARARFLSLARALSPFLPFFRTLSLACLLARSPSRSRSPARALSTERERERERERENHTQTHTQQSPHRCIPTTPQLGQRSGHQARAANVNSRGLCAFVFIRPFLYIGTQLDTQMGTHMDAHVGHTRVHTWIYTCVHTWELIGTHTVTHVGTHVGTRMHACAYAPPPHPPNPHTCPDCPILTPRLWHSQPPLPQHTHPQSSGSISTPATPREEDGGEEVGEADEAEDAAEEVEEDEADD